MIQPRDWECRCPSVAVSRETPSGRRLRNLPGLTSEVSGENAQRGRRHAVDPTRLPHRPRPLGLELGPDFVGKARHDAVVNIAEHHALVASEGIDISALALEVDV